MKNEYAKLPWSVEDTIENLKEIKEHLKSIAKRTNLHGKGEEDAKEIDFDFDRAIEALEKQIPKKPTEIDEKEDGLFYVISFMCPSCDTSVIGQPYKPKYCKHCGQKLDWGD